MPNSKKMKNMKITALARVGIESNRESIRFLIDGIDLMLRSGLSTRSTRNTLIVERENNGKNSTMPIMTTIKSSQFQASLM